MSEEQHYWFQWFLELPKGETAVDFKEGEVVNDVYRYDLPSLDDYESNGVANLHCYPDAPCSAEFEGQRQPLDPRYDAKGLNITEMHLWCDTPMALELSVSGEKGEIDINAAMEVIHRLKTADWNAVELQDVTSEKLNEVQKLVIELGEEIEKQSVSDPQEVRALLHEIQGRHSPPDMTKGIPGGGMDDPTETPRRRAELTVAGDWEHAGLKPYFPKLYHPVDEEGEEFEIPKDLRDRLFELPDDYGHPVIDASLSDTVGWWVTNKGEAEIEYRVEQAGTPEPGALEPIGETYKDTIASDDIDTFSHEVEQPYLGISLRSTATSTVGVSIN